VLLALVLASTPSLRAQSSRAAHDTLEVTLDEALRVGLERRPDLHAARAAAGEAAGRFRQARVLLPYNPVVEAKASGLIEPGSNSPLELILSQQIEWAGQRGLRAGAAEHAVDAATYRIRDAERLARHTIVVTWNATVAAEERYRIRLRGLALGTRLGQSVETQAREGKVSTLELNLARIHAGRVAAAEQLDRMARDTARFALGRALGLPDDTPVRPSSDRLALDDRAVPAADSLITLALRNRSDLHALTAQIESARTRRRLLAREAIPNLVLGGVAQRSAPGNELDWGLRFGFTLPIWNRNQGTRAAAAAEVDRLAAERLDLENRIRAEVRSAFAAWRAARDVAATLESQVLRPSRTNQSLVDFAYTEGQLDLPTALLLQAQLIEAELSFADAWLAERKAIAALESATGRPWQ
jgi:cobalt-zinc-cadmium efflux system outer membrane protein